MILNPIVPAIWLLAWLYRALKARSAPPSAGQGGSQALGLTVRPGFLIAFYLALVTLPLGITGAALVSEVLDNGYAALASPVRAASTAAPRLSWPAATRLPGVSASVPSRCARPAALRFQQVS